MNKILWGLTIVAVRTSPRLRWLVSAVPLAVGVYHLIKRYPRKPPTASTEATPIRIEVARHAERTAIRPRWHS